VAVADLGAHALDRLVRERARRPGGLALGHLEQEGRQHVGAAIGVGDLGVELHAHHAARSAVCSGERRVRRDGDDLEAGRERLHAVAVAHPHIDVLSRIEAVEDGHGFLDLDARGTVLALVGALDLAAQQPTRELHAIADTEHG
jgi:hypothetical protein